MRIIVALIFVLIQSIYGYVQGFSKQLHQPRTHVSCPFYELRKSKKSLKSIVNKKALRQGTFLSSSFSLDRTVLPGGSLPLHYQLILLTMTAITSIFAKIMSSRMEMAQVGYTTKNFISVMGGMMLSSVKFMKTGLIPRLYLISRVIAAKLSVLVENAMATMSRLFDFNASEELDLQQWQQCTVEERQILTGGYIKYRFKLMARNAVIPLYMGQELVMCAVDSSDRVHKEMFFPVSSPNARGYFDVIMRRMGDSLRDKFVRTLDTMALGDELAFKAGRYRLNYQGEDDPIRYSSMVVSGLGITPAMQMLRGVLPGKDSTVEEVDLVWVNEDRADFLCSTEVDGLQYGYIEKMQVTRVIQTDLFGKDVTENDVVRDAVSNYRPGAIAVVCGPDYFVTKVRAFFQQLKYPAENILCVVIP